MFGWFDWASEATRLRSRSRLTENSVTGKTQAQPFAKLGYCGLQQARSVIMKNSFLTVLVAAMTIAAARVSYCPAGEFKQDRRFDIFEK